MRDAQLFSQLIMERLTQLKTQRSGEPASASLSPREREVLQCVAKGLGNDTIAAEVGPRRADGTQLHLGDLHQARGAFTRRSRGLGARERGLGGP